MKTFKTYIYSLFAVLLAASHVQAVTSINLSLFGSSVTSDGFTYNPTTSTLTGLDAPGALLYPDPWTSVNLTTLDNYTGPSSLRLNLTGLATAPTSGGFSITLEGGSGKYLATTFNWNSFSSNSSTVTLPVNFAAAPVGFQWTNIVGWTFDSGGSGNAINATFTELTATAVPEPSTYALLGMSALGFGGYVMRRRRR
ncbi:MAG: PEP-CTERM sorting domain-containing protein [Chthoniobacterales bacterium]|nr:PEP-CTERM sorting domain-containing protein [Chthoniobacterales bacterium]